MEYYFEQAFYFLCILSIIVSLVVVFITRRAEPAALDPNFYSIALIKAILTVLIVAAAAYLVIRMRFSFLFGYAVLFGLVIVQLVIQFYPKRRQIYIFLRNVWPR